MILALVQRNSTTRSSCANLPFGLAQSPLTVSLEPNSIESCHS